MLALSGPGTLLFALLFSGPMGSQEMQQESSVALSQERTATPVDPASAEEILARKSNEDHWAMRLSSTDLLDRQASYDLLLLRAKLDPSVPDFLGRLALDTSNPELAWTARLGLRELDLRAKMDLKAPSSPAELMPGPYGSEQRLQSIMRQLVIEYPAWQFGIQEVRPRKPKAGTKSSGEAKSSRSIEAVVAPPTGAQRVRVRTDVLGVYVKRVALGAGAQRSGRPGLVVALIEPGSIAQRMALAVGDVLLRVNGRPMLLPADITKAMQGRSKREPITVQWVDQSRITQTATWTPDLR